MSIIEAAYEALETRNDHEIIPNNPVWEYLSFTYKGNHYAIIFEDQKYTKHYQIIRQFMVNRSAYSTVKDKYDERLLHFDCCNSLIGERRFEKGSIVYEFLLKPLHLEPKEKFDWDSCFLIKKEMEKRGIKYFHGYF